MIDSISMEFKVKKIFVPDETTSNYHSFQRGCTDVIVLFENENKYVASFFTYESIDKKRRHYQENGDFLKGMYFWSKNMVLVEDCTLPTIQKVVQHLIDEGEFQEAFKQL